MSKILSLALVLSTFFLNVRSSAEVLILKTGQVITGEILQRSDNGVLIKMDYGTFTYPPSMIKDVKAESDTPNAVAERGRLPDWGKIISVLATNGWAHELKQIPATVIENGVLQHVPYISFRCASGGYEINIYGDLDSPAGVEIGVLNYLLKNSQAKSNCVAFLSSVLTKDTDKEIVRRLKWDKEIAKQDGLTFETTLPIEEDAYGGWWVSVYDEKALGQARASGAELLAITQPIAPKPAPAAVYAAPAQPAAVWTEQDLTYSRPFTPSYSDTGGSGRVYVRGYTRKDGTYVRPYTRRRPSR